jgi:hypothetical protein
MTGSTSALLHSPSVFLWPIGRITLARPAGSLYRHLVPLSDIAKGSHQKRGQGCYARFYTQ